MSNRFSTKASPEEITAAIRQDGYVIIERVMSEEALLRLDMMATITMTPDGRPDRIYAAHILPGENEIQAYEVMPPIDPYHPVRFFLETTLALEAEMAQQLALRESGGKDERALLISVTTSSILHAAKTGDLSLIRNLN